MAWYPENTAGRAAAHGRVLLVVAVAIRRRAVLDPLQLGARGRYTHLWRHQHRTDDAGSALADAAPSCAFPPGGTAAVPPVPGREAICEGLRRVICLRPFNLKTKATSLPPRQMVVRMVPRVMVGVMSWMLH